MIEPSFRTLLVTTVGASPLAKSGSLAADNAAVALSAITACAEEESRAAFRVQTKPLPQNYFIESRHPSSQRGLDNGSGSVAGYNQLVCGDLTEVCHTGTPPLRTAGSRLSRLRCPHYTVRAVDWMIGRMIRACGADDVAGRRTKFRKLRFQMIADQSLAGNGYVCIRAAGRFLSSVRVRTAVSGSRRMMENANSPRISR